MPCGTEQLSAIKDTHRKAVVYQWFKGNLYLKGKVVSYNGKQYVRTFDGIGYTPPPDCTSGWEAIDE